MPKQSLSAAEQPKTIVFLGDSLTAGYGLDADQAYPALIERKLRERGWSFRVINAGVSGDTTSGGVRRVDWILKQPVAVLVLALGANDGLRGLSVDAMKTNLLEIIRKARQRCPDVEIIVAGMLVPPNMGPDYTESYKQAFAEVARESSSHFIPFLLEGVGGEPRMNLPDGIHPNAEGYRLVAENVWKVLEPVLSKVQARSSSS